VVAGEPESKTEVQSVKVIESSSEADNKSSVTKVSEVVVQKTSTIIDEPFHKVVEEVTTTSSVFTSSSVITEQFTSVTSSGNEELITSKSVDVHTTSHQEVHAEPEVKEILHVKEDEEVEEKKDSEKEFKEESEEKPEEKEQEEEQREVEVVHAAPVDIPTPPPSEMLKFRKRSPLKRWRQQQL